MIHRLGQHRGTVVADDAGFVVTRIQAGFKNLHFKIGNFCAAQAADQFFGLAGKHTTADNLYPAGTLTLEMWFEKHDMQRLYVEIFPTWT